MVLKGKGHRPKGMRAFRIAVSACLVALCGALLTTGPVSCTGTEIPDPDEGLFGTVRRPDGSPVSGARVIAWAQSDAMARVKNDATQRVKDTVQSDSKGRFVFKDTLATGNYNLFFEADTLLDPKSRPLGRCSTYYKPDRPNKIPMTLSHPVELVLTVKAKYNATDAFIEGASCTIKDSPYEALTGSGGVAVFFVPRGEYTVHCGYSLGERTFQLNLDSVSEWQETVELYPGGKVPDPLPPPDSLSVTYDENSGIANLAWPPVNDSRLLNYGVGRVNEDSGGGTIEYTTYFTYWRDPVFAATDSVQLKNLQYSVNSLKRDPNGNGGSRRSYYRLAAARPWVYGARIDSLVAIPRDSAYRAGDTIRFAGFWTNRMYQNDTLYWWVQGAADMREIRVNPPAKGSDTLSVVLPASGDYKINLSIHDAEGYRSWLALPFRL